ncbi:hypothetical protein SJ05684_c11430 [Sinorhizobium sojae CCBAU 05684]|uniref:Uncharacterized protein n=1 Tax=Sinorhizobium sojae CCBAU 05684 TaxID=716928 RepID=A0A249PBE7_9HYPH|nr:hypothetical protein SJ05684_c11430 [Sinorhizobium sojae CCBAU 05684]
MNENGTGSKGFPSLTVRALFSSAVVNVLMISIASSQLSRTKY